MVTHVLGDMDSLRVQLVTSLQKLAKVKDREIVTVGSVCTGWGVGDMVVDALNSALGHLGHRAPKARSLSGFGLVWSGVSPCFNVSGFHENQTEVVLDNIIVT